MRTRLEDVAARAGVSPARVSRVVNGRPGVSEQGPMVLVNGHIDALDAPSVSTDDLHAARTAVEHLRSLGHQRIGCAMAPWFAAAT